MFLYINYQNYFYFIQHKRLGGAGMSRKLAFHAGLVESWVTTPLLGTVMTTISRCHLSIIDNITHAVDFYFLLFSKQTESIIFFRKFLNTKFRRACSVK